MSFSPRQLCVSLLILVAILGSQLRPADRLSAHITDEALANAAISYASARMINGAISVLKGTEVGVAVGGTVTFSVGEILDPLHDLIEQLSTVLLVALTSLGIQKVLISLLASPLFNVLLWCAAAILLGTLSVRRLRNLFNPAMRGFMLLLLMRFSVVAVVLANQWVYTGFLSQQYSEANQQLAQASVELEQSRTESQVPTDSVDSAGVLGVWQQVRNSLDPKQRLDAIRTAVEQTLEHAIDLITVFVLQTVILPLLFLWFLYRAAGLLVRADYEKIAPPKIGELDV